MADDETTTEPTKDTEKPRRRKLPEWCRDATGTDDDVAGFIIVVGFPQEYVRQHQARKAAEAAAKAEEPGEDAGPADGREKSDA